MDGFASELRIALRTLIGRERAYAVLAVLMLALGVAGGTAVFCVYDGAALRPLPYRDSGALYWIWSVRPDVDRAFFSIPDLHDFRARSRQTSDIAALTPFGGNHWRGEDSRRVNGLRVDDRFFPLLGVQPAFGRLIDETDARDNTRVIVLGWDLFQRELGGDMHRLAEPWNMNGEAWQVIGVLPESFVFPGPDADLHFAVPLSAALDPRRENRGANFVRLLARSREGADHKALSAEFAALSHDLAREHPSTNAMKMAPDVVPLHVEMSGRPGAVVGVLLTAILMLLALIGANLGALCWLRAQRREIEFGVQRALGAGYLRLLRPVLAEILCLGLIAAAAAALLAPVLLVLLHQALADFLLHANAVRFDTRSAVFGLTVLGGLLGLVAIPAMIGLRKAGGIAALRSGLRTVRGPGFTGRVLLAIELALALAIAGSMAGTASTWARQQRLELGFSAERIASARITLPVNAYPDRTALLAYLGQVEEGLRAHGLTFAMASALPLSQVNSRVDFDFPGHVPVAEGFVPTAQARWVTPGYFAMMGLELVSGRILTDADREGAVPVAVVDAALQSRYWPQSSPHGMPVTVSGQESTLLVGTVGTVPHFQIGETANGTLYLPVEQVSPRYFGFVASRIHVLARGEGNVSETTRILEQVLRTVAPEVPPSEMRPIQELIDRATSGARLATALLGLLSMAAVLVAGVGAYALVSSALAARRRELALRSALGSPGWRLHWHPLRDSAAAIVGGLMAGAVLGAALLPRVLQPMGAAAALDPVLLSGVIGTVIVAVLLAAAVATGSAAKDNIAMRLRGEG